MAAEQVIPREVPPPRTGRVRWIVVALLFAWSLMQWNLLGWRM